MRGCGAPRKTYVRQPLLACTGVQRHFARMRLRSGSQPISYAGAVHLGLIALVVREYDPAISFFVNVLGFELAADSPARTSDGRPKRVGGRPATRCRDRPAARAG
jgi:hypothetical protein